MIEGGQHRLDHKWDSFFHVLNKEAFCGRPERRELWYFRHPVHTAVTYDTKDTSVVKRKIVVIFLEAI
jgi:hypothetical protein